MNLAPLFEATTVVKVHFAAALTAFVLGLAQFVAPKGTIPHRTIGWIWVVLMLVLILGSFFIRERFVWGFFGTDVCLMPSKTQSWMTRCAVIHTVSMYALLMVPYAALHARRGNIEFHRWSMFSILLGAIVVAGSFAFQPPRMLYTVFFGS